MNPPALRGLVALHAILYTSLLSTAMAWAQQETGVPGQPDFDALAARYRQILHERPRHGTAFDLWYRLYLDAGKLDELVASVENDAGRKPDDFAAQMLLGLVYDRRARFDEAIRAYSEAVRLAPEDYYPLAAQGSLLARRYQFDEAAAALERALALEPPRAELLDLNHQLGRLYLRQGKTKEALATWSRVAELFPDDARVLQELAEVLAEQEQLDEAVRRWQQLAALPGLDRYQQLHASIEAASLDARRGKTNSATRAFDEILDELEPDSWLAQDVRKRVEDVYEQLDDLEGLVAFCEQRLKRRPDELSTIVQLTRALSRSGHTDEAIDRFRGAIEVAPSRRDIREALIQELVRADRVAEATNECERLVELVPDDADLLLLLGRLYLDGAGADERPEAEKKATQTWERIAALRPDDPGSAVQVAEACRRAALGSESAAAQFSVQSGRVEAGEGDASPLLKVSEQYYREAVRRAPEAAEYREYLGEFLHTLGRGEKAVAEWSQIAAGPRATFENWSRLTEVYAGFGYLDEAVAAGERALQLRPDDVAALEQQVRLLMRQERFDDALDDLSRLEGLAEEPQLAEDALHLRVDLLAAARRMDAEIEQLRAQEPATATSVRDRWLLGLLLAHQRRYAEAARSLQEAIESAPNDQRLARAAASLYEQSGDLGRALGHYRRLAELDAKNRAAHYEQIARIELALGRAEQAEAAADALIRLSPSSLAGYRLRAELSFRLEQPEQGLEVLRRAVRVAPRDLDIRLDLAYRLGKFDRVDEAMEHYWRAFELTDSLAGKLSVVTSMTALARGSNRFEDVLDKLRRMRRVHDHPKVLTLCLVEALRRGEAYDDARRELAGLLQGSAPDPAVLAQLVALSEAISDWQTAVEYQKQLVALAPDRQNLQSLARLYDELGDDRAALEVWQRMLSELDDPDSVLGVVDHHLDTGAFAQAVEVVKMGLAEQPNDWRLLLRAAFAQLALDDSEAAKTSFESILAVPEGTVLAVAPSEHRSGRTTRTTSPATWQQPSLPELREIQAAQLAYRRFQMPRAVSAQFRQLQQQREALRAMERRIQELRSQRGAGNERVAARLPREERRVAQLKAALAQIAARTRTSAGSFPSDLESAKIEAAVGLYLLGRQRQSAAGWMEEELDAARKDPQRLRNVALVRAATNDETSWEQTRALFAELLPHDALVHVVELYAPTSQPPRVIAVPANRQPPASRRQGFEAVRASYEWLREHARAYAADFDAQYLQRAMSMGRIDAIEEFLDERLASFQRFDELAKLIPYAQAIQDRSIQRRFFVRIAELASGPATQTNTAHLAAAIQVMLLGISGRSLNASNDEDVQTVLAVFDTCVRLSASTRPAGSLAALTRPLPMRVPANAVVVRGNVAVPLNAVRIQRGSPSLLQVIVATQGGGRVLIEPTADRFPAPTAHLDSAMFATLQALYGWLHQADREPLLCERFDEQAAEAGGTVAASYQTAGAFVQWWSGRRPQAVQRLRDACAAAPQEAVLCLTLASALHASGDDAEALSVLNRTTPSPPLTEQFDALRGRVFEALHADGGEALLQGLFTELQQQQREPYIGAFFGRSFEPAPANARVSVGTAQSAAAMRAHLLARRRSLYAPSAVRWSVAALNETRLAEAIEQARQQDRLEALHRAAEDGWQRYPDNRQLGALVTLTRVAQGRAAEAASAAQRWAELLEADPEGMADPSTWQVMHACLAYPPTRRLAFRLAEQLEEFARLRERRDLRLALLLAASRAHVQEGDLDAAVRLVERLRAVFAPIDGEDSGSTALDAQELGAMIEVLERLDPALLAAAMRTFTALLVDESGRVSDTTPLVWGMYRIAPRIPPEDKAAVLDDFIRVVFPDGPEQLPVLLPREGAGPSANLGQAVVALAEDAGRLSQLRDRLDAHPLAEALPMLALRAEAAAAARDDDATDRLLGEIASREQQTGQRAALWSPRCVLPGFGERFEAEFRQDFRGDPIDEEKLQLGAFAVPLDRRPVRTDRDVGDYLHRDEDGLRITLPAGAGNLGHVGVATRFSVRGDFEITASFEVLSIQTPQRVAGMRIYVGGSERSGVASLGRVYRGGVGHHLTAHKEKAPLGRNSVAWNFPSEATSGRLRLIRRGATLFYLVAEAGSDDFRILHSTDWTAEDLRWIRAVVDYRSTTTQNAVDVRWWDFAIRAESFLEP